MFYLVTFSLSVFVFFIIDGYLIDQKLMDIHRWNVDMYDRINKNFGVVLQSMVASLNVHIYMLLNNYFISVKNILMGRSDMKMNIISTIICKSTLLVAQWSEGSFAIWSNLRFNGLVIQIGVHRGAQRHPN